MNFSIITTCKNRLAHLKETLPLMMAVDGAEVIVVDYGCEQGTAEWVRTHYPQARVVTVTDDPVFHVSRARNIGARAASARRLCFVDADLFIVGDLSKWLIGHYDKASFYVIPADGSSTAGFLLCERTAFEAVGGYDEALRGWAPEDMDLYERIEMSGPRRNYVPETMFSSIHHTDDSRLFGNESGAFKNREHSLALGALYRTIKRDLSMLTQREPELEFRKEIFRQINALDLRAETEGKLSITLEINLGPRTIRPSTRLSRTVLVYEFERPVKA